MKDRVSLSEIRKATQKDVWKISGLSLVMGIIPLLISIAILLVYKFKYANMPIYMIAITVGGVITSATLQAKALLDIVYNRKQDLFANPLALMQAFLVQAAVLGLWYGVYSDFGGIMHASLGILKGPMLLLFGFLFILMRLQFTSLYILEQKCSILQAMQRSWLLTKHNNWLFERFVLWQAAEIVSILIFSSHLNINFSIMSVAMIVIFATPMQVRMFKELE